MQSRLGTHPQLYKHLPILSKLLNGPALRNLHEHGYSSYLSGAFKEIFADFFHPSATLLQVASEIFSMLKVHYRSDYVFRSAIANKIFLGRHSPETTVLLPEFRVGQSRADIVMVNGTTTVYEIKSELDNFDRLNTQLDDYLKVFDLVYVVTTESMSDLLKLRIPEPVGILSLSTRYTFKICKPAISNMNNINVRFLADSLRIQELKQLTYLLCGEIPEASNIHIFNACLTRLLEYPPKMIHNAMLKILKKRKQYTIEDFSCVPKELVSAYIESKISPKYWPCLTSLLETITIKDFLEE